jgi:hypothetical protein
LSETFAIASREELWLRGSKTESRISHGVARQSGNRIDASDARDESLVKRCDAELDTASAIARALGDARVRVVVRATREESIETVETTITVRIDGVAIVTSVTDAMHDVELLRSAIAARPVRDPAPLPIVWRNGSAAVLLHEAIGHAREQNAPTVAWPEWLHVETPIAARRETFRDVPLPRMTRLVARHSNAPFALPDERIEVLLVAGGGFDPVSSEVAVHVAVSSAGAFTLRASRAAVAASLLGATGEPIRYPGVICSREGQELYVPSIAPVMVTAPLS